MITTRIYGGLGNQLFQYTAALALAEQIGTQVRFDFSVFPGHFRKFRLDQFQIPEAQRVTAADFEKKAPSKALLPRVKRVIRRKIDANRPWYRRQLVKEPKFDFNPELFKAGDNITMEGYWQSHRYFAAIEGKVRDQLEFAPDVTPLDPALSRDIERVESVALHVRRGDYLLPENAVIFQHLSTCYYFDAVAEMRRKLGDFTLFIFSDDPDWCRANLSEIGDVRFVTLDSDLREFRHMSLCKHHIISNSTFAWWSAWLAKNPDQQVISPGFWFKSQIHTMRDLIPEHWQILDPQPTHITT